MLLFAMAVQVDHVLDPFYLGEVDDVLLDLHCLRSQFL